MPHSTSARTATTRTPVLFASLQGYRGAWLRGDVVAGLTVWAVLVPESLAYATIGGSRPSSGSTRLCPR